MVHSGKPTWLAGKGAMEEDACVIENGASPLSWFHLFTGAHVVFSH